jgi:3-oxoacyl-[acyl-carrier-protein] synthase III
MSLTILGTGMAVPKRRVTNDDLSQVMETSDAWIRERTGIGARYLSAHENTSDLGTMAAQAAIKHANIDPKTIDGILVATLTPDAMMPSTAALIQAKLGLNGQRLLAFDLNAACSGFILALQTADALIQAGSAKRMLVIGAETLSKILDYSDRTTAVLFGDGAGCFVVEASTTTRMTHFANTEGDLDQTLITEPLALNPDLSNHASEVPYLRMKGQAVFRFAVKAVEDALVQVCAQRGIAVSELDLIIPHQANARIIRHVADKMGLPIEKFVMNLEEYGNTSSASIPIAYTHALASGRIVSGMTLALVGFGAGLTWAATLIELKEESTCY